MKRINETDYLGLVLVVIGCLLAVGMVSAPVAATTEVPAGASGVDTGTVTDENITIQGQITRPDGAPAGNEFVLVFIGYGEENTGFDDPKTAPNGEFSISVPADRETVLAFEQNTFDRDGVPDLYTVASVNSSSDVDLGEITLPRAYVLNVTVVDSDGNPVENASVDIGHRNDGRRIGTIAETNEEGQYVITSGATPGYEVAGNVSVKVTPPDSDDVAVERNLTVTEDRDITITLDEAAASGVEAYTDERGIVTTSGLRAAVDDWSAREIATELLQLIVAAWSSEDPVS